MELRASIEVGVSIVIERMAGSDSDIQRSTIDAIVKLAECGKLPGTSYLGNSHCSGPQSSCVNH